MKKIINLFLVITLIMSIFISPSSAAATTLNLNWKTATIGLGEEYKIKATTNSTKSIKWTTSDKAVVIVDETGLIKGVKTGKATVTATIDGVRANVTVTVKKAPDKVFAEVITVNAESTAQIKLTFPKGTTSKGNNYISSNINIAKVTSNGIVTGVNEGNCNITITTFNGKKVKIKVKVTPTEHGNTASNIANYGGAAISDDWIYYSSNGLYKIKTDGTENTLIDDKNDVGCINIIGEWIYYIDTYYDYNKMSLLYNIYKIKTNGTGKTIICNDECLNGYVVIGNWIYYLNNSDDDKLYKIKTNGTGRKKISNDTGINYINVIGDWIYYGNNNDGMSLYKMKIDGTNKTKIYDDNKNDIFGNNFIVEGDWIYYRTWEDDGGIYKVKTDGSKKTKVSNDSSLGFNVVDDWIYYANASDNRKLYKIKTDGTGRKKLYDDDMLHFYLSVVNDWIYYYSYKYEGVRFKIKTDGTEWQSLTK